MVNTTYFTYDGVFSGTYGLQVAEFDVSSVEENEAFSPNLTTLKVPSLVRFFHGGIEYDSAPTCEFTVVSEDVIPPELRSAILSWMIGRNEFKPLKFHNDDWEDFVYYCVFTHSSTVYVNGQCHGFKFTATFDSPFARGASTVVSTPDEILENFESNNNIGYTQTYNLVINNKSDIKDGYVYPVVEFEGNSISIINTTDDAARKFEFGTYGDGEKPLFPTGVEGRLKVDCETKIITAEKKINDEWVKDDDEKLGNFLSKKWLRLRPGNNTLRVTSEGPVTITCPWYVMIGY